MGASADNTATFAIDLQTQGAQANADALGGSLESLGTSIDENAAQLARMQKALRDMKGGSSVNIQAFENLKKQIDAKKASIGQMQAKYVELGGTFKRTKKPIDDNAAGLKELLERMQKGGGPIGGLAGRLQGLRGLLAGGGVLVVGAVAFAGALMAIAAAATVAYAALLRYGIAAADAYRAERLQLEGLTKIRNWYGIAAGKATDLQAAIDRVSGSVASGREEVNGMAVSLYRAGFRGGALENALQGVATATAAAGQEQGALAQQMFIAYGRTAAGAKKVADDIKARFGGVAAAQMLSLGTQTKKLRENFQALFTGLKIEGFLKALKNMTDLFSQNTASGRALKQILELALQPFINGLETIGPIAKRFYQGVILGAQEVTIAYYNVRLALKEAFGGRDVTKNVDWLTFALNAGKIAAFSFAVGLGLVAIGVALLVSPFILAGVAGYKFAEKVHGVYNVLKTIDWGTLGSALIDGFVGGITGNIIKVIGAVKNVGKVALETLRHALDSHSPSRKGLNLGRTYPQGVGVGIEKDLPYVRKAAAKVGIVVDKAANDTAPDAPRSPFGGDGKPPAFGPGLSASTPASPPASSMPPVEINIRVVVEGGKNADNDELEAMLRRLIEQQVSPAVQQALQGIAISIGAKAA
jgi:hypothetical protein